MNNEKKQPIQSKISTIIYTEGEVTEIHYLNLIRPFVKKTFETEPVGTSASSFLGNLLHNQQKKPNTKPNTMNSQPSKPTISELTLTKLQDLISFGVYFIFDTENNFDDNGVINNSSMYNIVKKPKNSKKLDILKKLRTKMFFTNDMFEYWLVLHFDNNAKLETYKNIAKYIVHSDKQIAEKGNESKYKKRNINKTCEASRIIYNIVYCGDKISILTETDEAFSEMHLLIDELNKP